MIYTVIGDSLIEHINCEYVNCHPSMTLQHWIDNYCPLIDNDENEIFVFCFGLNDLGSGIHSDNVIKNYELLENKYTNCIFILPPFQTSYFYCDFNDVINTHSIKTFVTDYIGVDGIHPTNDTLDKIKENIECIVNDF